MRCLVTGIGGFAGAHLTEALLANGDSVAGFTLGPLLPDPLQALADSVPVRLGDIRDSEAISAAMEDFRPEAVYHLAALPHVDRSWDDRQQTLDTNILGTAAVLQAAARLDRQPTTLLVSTGQVYGRAPESAMPLAEEAPLEPVSPYATSKLCAEILGQQAWRADGLPVVHVRPFNYAGPGQEIGFVFSDFARQVARAETGAAAPEIEVGNLEARRDFTDVRDMVKGFVLAVTRGTPGDVYNLASGRAVPVQRILDELLELSSVEIRVIRDPARMHPADISLVVGDASLARSKLGWTPAIPLEVTVRDTLEYWREQTAKGTSAGRDA